MSANLREIDRLVAEKVMGWPGRYGAVAVTAPLAICLAALKAKGVEVPR